MIELNAIFDADDNLLDGLEDLVEEYADEFELNTRLRQVHFFAQIKEEVGEKFRYAKAENLNYSCNALKKLFRYYKKHPKEAEQDGRCNGHKANQEAIANKVYANRIGNGGIDSGDGWKYRGRGMLQLTGRANYERIQKIIKERTGLDLNIVEDPDLLLNPAVGMLAAMAFWYDKKLYKIADMGDTKEVVNKITRVINRYTHSYDKRVKHFIHIAALTGGALSSEIRQA